LQATNNLPEVTGRICPAPCEAACVLAINDEAVTIEDIEREIAERGFERALIVPHPRRRAPGARLRWSARGRQVWPPRSS
jgi:glutamate synthase (NADPH/NADH) small chain